MRDDSNGEVRFVIRDLEKFQIFIEITILPFLRKLEFSGVPQLRQQYQNILNLFDPLIVSKAQQRALLIEKKSRSSSLAWTTPPSQTLAASSTTTSTTANAPGPMALAPRPLPTQPDATPLGRSSRHDALRCFSCGKLGHRQTACPKIGRHTLLVDGIELKGSDDVIVDDYVPEEDVLEEQVHGDTGTLLILRHSCFMPKQ